MKAMEGSHAVFAVTNYWEKMDMQLEIDQGKRLADAAKETDVQHFILSSLLNINTRMTPCFLPRDEDDVLSWDSPLWWLSLPSAASD